MDFSFKKVATFVILRRSICLELDKTYSVYPAIYFFCKQLLSHVYIRNVMTENSYSVCHIDV